MNTHLLLALYALFRSERLLRAVARVRFLIDMAAAMLIPSLDFRILGPF